MDPTVIRVDWRDPIVERALATYCTADLVNFQFAGSRRATKFPVVQPMDYEGKKVAMNCGSVHPESSEWELFLNEFVPIDDADDDPSGQIVLVEGRRYAIGECVLVIQYNDSERVEAEIAAKKSRTTQKAEADPVGQMGMQL
jgi:hypothetical protein